MDIRLRARPVDPASPSADAEVMAMWSEVSAGTAETFQTGLAAAETTGALWGARRAVEHIRGALRASEAVKPYVAPPADAAGFGSKYVSTPAGGTFRPDLQGTPFDVAFPQARGAANRHAATLVRNVDDETRRRLRGMVAQARADKVSADVLAKRITTEFPYMAVGRPQHHIRSRAHLIAVTETSRAYEKGQRYVAEKSAAAGLRMVKSWLTVGDGHVDGRCSDNEAQGEIPYDESFVSLDEEPPAHPGCRCTSQYRALSTAELGIDNPYAPGGPLDLIAPAVQAVTGFKPHGEKAFTLPDPQESIAGEVKYQKWALRQMRGDPAGRSMLTRIRDSFKAYTGSLYGDVNRYGRGVPLRDHSESTVKEHIANMEKGMVTLRGVQPIQMWRGMPESTIKRVFNVNDVRDIVPGMEFRDGGFMSLSGSRQFANGWGQVLLDVRVPPGTRVRYLGGTEHVGGGGSISNLPHEYETLTETGMTMVAREIKHVGSKTIIRVDAYHKRMKRQP